MAAYVVLMGEAKARERDMAIDREKLEQRIKSRIDWFRARREEWLKQGVESKAREMYEASIALEEIFEEIQSGAFDDDTSEIQRLRA